MIIFRQSKEDNSKRNNKSTSSPVDSPKTDEIPQELPPKSTGLF